MKAIGFLVLLAGLNTACSKVTDTVTPGLTTGTYEIKSITQTSAGKTVTITFPYSETIGYGTVITTAQFDVVRSSATRATMIHTEKATGKTDVVTQLGEFEIKGADIYNSVNKIGTCDGSTLIFDTVNSQGTRSLTTAQKR